MKKETTVKKGLRQRRIFSEAIKKGLVKDIERGRCSVAEGARELGVAFQTVYGWLYKYSPSLCKNKVLVMEEKSEAYQSKEKDKRIKELEAAVGRKQMEIDLLNKILELAGKDTGMDLKKSSNQQLSRTSGSVKEGGTDTK
jgi:transposase-like protein